MHNEQDENLNNQIFEESPVAEEIQSAIELDEQDILIGTSSSQASNEELDRRMAERLTEAVIVLGNNVTGLTGTLNAASQGIQEKSAKLQDRILESQARQRKGFILLTIVLAISTIIYTSMTWLSISAMRQANEIQQKLLKVQQEHNLLLAQQEQKLLLAQREQKLLKVQQPSRPNINQPDPRNITRSAQKKRTVSPKR